MIHFYRTFGFSEIVYVKGAKNVLIGPSNQRHRKVVEQELKVEKLSPKQFKTKKGSFIWELFGGINGLS